MNKKNEAKANILKRIKQIDLEPLKFMEDDNTITKRSTCDSDKKVCIITEDRGNGYQFFVSYIHYNYPDMTGSIIGSTGHDGFRYILEEYRLYDVYIIIMDRGINERKYNEIMNSIKEFRKDLSSKVEFYVFQPICFEEILLSFYRIEDYIELNNVTEGRSLKEELKKALKGKTNKINYNQYKSLKCSTNEQVCEKLVYELTKDTPFECFHGQKEIKNKQPRIPAYLSPCWRCPCCTVEKYDFVQKIDVNRCKKPKCDNKMDYIAQYSLLCGLTYILDKIYGNRLHAKGYWNDMKPEYLSELVKEV